MGLTGWPDMARLMVASDNLELSSARQAHSLLALQLFSGTAVSQEFIALALATTLTCVATEVT